MSKILLSGNEFSLIHRTNKRIKRVSITMENQNEIIVKTPLKFKSHLIKQIVYDHEEWILKSLQRVPVKNEFEFKVGGTIPFLGKEYPIEFIEDSKYKNPKFSFEVNHFKIFCTSVTQPYDSFVEGIKKFYKFQAHKIIDPLFTKWCDITHLYPQKISYRSAKKQWGSCNHKNEISMNYKLLQFTPEIIEYVVLHELCHIEHKNHSRLFWDMVYLYMPDYKRREKQLKGKFF